MLWISATFPSSLYPSCWQISHPNLSLTWLWRNSLWSLSYSLRCGETKLTRHQLKWRISFVKCVFLHASRYFFFPSMKVLQLCAYVNKILYKIFFYTKDYIFLTKTHAWCAKGLKWDPVVMFVRNCPFTESRTIPVVNIPLTVFSFPHIHNAQFRGPRLPVREVIPMVTKVSTD